MKKFLALGLLPFVAAQAFGAAFTPGGLAVLQVGDGSASLSSGSTALFLREFSLGGTSIQSITLPTAGGSVLTLSGTAGSEGQLTRSSDGTLLTFGGYATAPGLAAVGGTTAASVSRGVGILDYNANYSRAATGSAAFDGGSIRGAVSDGANYWLSGTSSGTGSPNGGIWYSGAGSTPTQVRGGNLRDANIFGGNLYFSSGSATPGVGLHTFSGLPVGAAASSLFFATLVGSSPSPYDFAINNSGTVAYVADDRSGANGGGIQRWNFDGSAWNLAYTLSSGTGSGDGTRQLTVDFSGASPILYATTTENSANRLISFTDTGAGSAFSLLATAAANTVFRGVDFTPVNIPEPSAIGFGLLGAAFVAFRRRLAR